MTAKAETKHDFIDGEPIFVGGAAAGMGYCVARLAAAAGAEVHATDNSSDGLQSLADDGLHADLLDVTEQADVSAYFAAREDFDGLVNMAGWVHHGSLTQTELADWHRSFQVNLDSMYFVLHAALPWLDPSGRRQHCQYGVFGLISERLSVSQPIARPKQLLLA